MKEKDEKKEATNPPKSQSRVDRDKDLLKKKLVMEDKEKKDGELQKLSSFGEVKGTSRGEQEKGDV